MPAHPLTHHDILGLIAPFTHSGRQLDLPASDRIGRRLQFKAVACDAASAGSALSVALELACNGPGDYSLIRRATRADGLQARLEAGGADPAALLALVDAVAVAGQFRCGPGWAMAFAQRLEAVASPSQGAPGARQCLLTEARGQVEGLTLLLTMPTVRGYPAELDLVASGADPVELPADLLAVLGWDWATLRPSSQGWRSTLRLHGKEPTRSRQAEDGLEAGLEHIAQTLAEPPVLFHTRRVARRWGVVLRDAIPLLVLGALVAVAMAVPRLALENNSVLRMLIMNAPPLLLVIGFCMRELPHFSIPRPPRPSSAATWWPEPATAAEPSRPG